MAWYDDHLSDEMVLKLARQMDRAIMEMICAGCDRTPKLSDTTIEDFVPDIRRSIDREWGDMTRVTFTGVNCCGGQWGKVSLELGSVHLDERCRWGGPVGTCRLSGPTSPATTIRPPCQRQDGYRGFGGCARLAKQPPIN